MEEGKTGCADMPGFFFVFAFLCMNFTRSGREWAGFWNGISKTIGYDTNLLLFSDAMLT